MAATISLTVDGLPEFARAISQLGSTAARGLRLALNDVADVVIETARPKVPVLSGAAAATIRPRSTRNAVRITAGGDKAPYYPWLDFGGHVGRHGTAARTFIKDGRYLYPTYYDQRRSGVYDKVLEQHLRRVAVAAGLKVD